MSKEKKVIAIIPARGGSKGIHRKNIKIMAGKPLIAWTIESAKRSKLLDDFYVSTEDKEIAKISGEYGAKVIDRPLEFAEDDSDQMDAHKHALEKVGGDYIMILQPTSPIRDESLIDDCIREFFEAKADSLATGFMCQFFEWGTYDQNRQNLKTFFKDDGNIKILKSEIVIQKKRIGEFPIRKVISKEQNLDINDKSDFWVCEQILKKRMNKERIIIGDKIISENQPVFVIAEAGVNHNGNVRLAKKLVDAAVESGVDAVKFQTFKSKDLVKDSLEMADYQKKNIGKKQSQLEMLKKLELDYSDFIQIKRYCDERGIIFLSTPHTDDAAEFLRDLVPAFKIASGDLTNLPFLKKIARYNKPMILATGMSTLEEVKEALHTIHSEGNREVFMLHCTTNYPCPLEEINLGAMQTMQKELDCLIGYSDHTLGIEIPLMAKKLGAVVIEKHFTLDKNMEGPDHKASLNPSELKEMVEYLRNPSKSIGLSEVVMGDSEKKPTEKELRILKIARKSIVANKDINKGKIIQEEDLIMKRAGKGLMPKHLENLIGKKAKQDIKKDEIITFEKVRESEKLKIIRSAVGSMPSLGLINELQNHGVEIIGIDAEPLSFGLHKLNKSYTVPLAKDPDFVDRLLGIIEKEKPDAILSGPEEEVLVLSKNKKKIEEKGTLVLCPDYECVKICADKIKTNKKFRELGIPFLKTFSSKELATFPCVIKPNFGRGGSMKIAMNKNELEIYIKKFNEPVIIQEFIKGQEYTIDVLADKYGNSLSIVPRIRLDIESGISVKGQTIYDKEIIDYCSKIVKGLKLFGPSCIQCIKNEKGIKFIEINTRFGGGAILSIKSDPTIIPNLLKIIKKENTIPNKGFKRGLIVLRNHLELFINEDNIKK